MIVASLDLKAGDVFTWEKYPMFEHEEKDRRWFIFLGNNSLQCLVYEVTATTKLEYYATGGVRSANNHFKISAGIAGLTLDSIIDLTKYFNQIPENLVNSCKDAIKKQGKLPQDTINTLVRHIKNDKDIPNIIKKDIYRYLQDAGFTVNTK
ncbi:hypothetical protein FACS1894102_7380 [Spirochaetia bacterium]|nr:hypothetical protein FACS1894102_7380 [Spirochaetia bacterium]